MESAHFWLRGRDGQSLGPLSLSQLVAMKGNGLLPDLVESSRDGRSFRPIAEDPDLQPLLVAPTPLRQPPSPRQLQAAPPRGRLEELSPLRLYYLIAASESSGLLQLGEGDNGVLVWFKKGTPQAAHCEAMGLGNFLIEQGQLRPDQLQLAQPAIAQAGGDVAGGLFAAGLLNPSLAFPLLQQHALAVVARGLSFESGPFAFDPAAPIPASSYPLGNRWQIFCNGARKLPASALRRRLEGREKMAPRLVGPTAELQLTALETRLLTLLDGRRSLAAIARELISDALTFQRLLVLLNDVDKIEWKEAVAEADAPASQVTPPVKAAIPAAVPAALPPPARPPPPVAFQPAVQVGPSSAPDDLRSLQALFEDLKGKNLFARLGFARSRAPIPQLKPVYFQLAKTYHPDTVAPDAPPTLREIKQDILSLLNEAYGVLGNDRDRVAYFDDLEAKEQVGDLNVEAILAAEDQFQRAVLVFKARRYAEALQLFEGCIQLNAQEAEFYAWRGYASFLCAPDKNAAQASAMADLGKAIQLSARCAQAHLFAGHIAKLQGHLGPARQAYQKVLEIEPTNIEAQRELRLFEQRRNHS